MGRKFSPHVFWTPEEEKIITKMYPSAAHINEICTALPGRSKSQIQNHANALGVTRPPRIARTQDETREAKRAYMAVKRAADPDKNRQYHRERHHKNREVNTAKLREYAAKRFFWTKAMHLRGQCRATPIQIASLWKRQKGKCALTGRKLDRTAQLDHILPKCRGGKDDASNLQWLCSDANLAKRHMTDDEFISLCGSVMRWLGERIDAVSSVITSQEE